MFIFLIVVAIVTLFAAIQIRIRFRSVGMGIFHAVGDIIVIGRRQDGCKATYEAFSVLFVGHGGQLFALQRLERGKW